MSEPDLKGLVIAIAGTFSRMSSHAFMKRWIEIHGGVFSPRVNQGCTHLVTTEEMVENNGRAVRSALEHPHIQIVSYEWTKNPTRSYEEDTSVYLIPPQNKDSGDSADAAIKDEDQDAGETKGRRSTRSTQSSAKSQAEPPNTHGEKRTAGSVKQDESEVKDEQPSRPKKKSKTAPEDEKVEQGDEQKEPTANLKVPLDRPVPYERTHRVYIQDDGTIWDAALNQTNATNNNNKFYILQLLEPLSAKGSYVLWARWGRVGEYGQMSENKFSNAEAAQKAFFQKFKSKTGLPWTSRFEDPKPGKYIFLERNYEDDSGDEDLDAKAEALKGQGKRIEVGKPKIEDEPESNLHPSVRDFLRLIFNQQHFDSTMLSMSYDANKLPLGKLSKRTLTQGFRILKQIADIISSGGAMDGTNIDILSNQYLSVIPHAFGRDRPPVIRSLAMVQQEVDLLTTLTDMELANEIMNVSSKATGTDADVLSRQFDKLNLKEMTPLNSNSTEYAELADYLHNTKGVTHNMKYQLKHIFRIERPGEKERFLNSPYANLKKSDRRLLWHGSRTSNYGGILSQGLRIAPPEAPATGYMFDKGIYLADVSSKSANYCCPHMSGGMGVLLLCEAELGDPVYEPDGADCQAATHAKEQGHVSTFGKGANYHNAWKDAGCVSQKLKGVQMPDGTRKLRQRENRHLLYNEYIVYDVAQVQQRYAFVVRMIDC